MPFFFVVMLRLKILKTYHGNQRPFDHGRSESSEGTVPSSHRDAQTVRKQESNPIKYESDWTKKENTNAIKVSKKIGAEKKEIFNTFIILK